MKTSSAPSAASRNCEDVRKNLLAYMSRELGKAPSELVSRHLHKCKACQAEAAEIQTTLNLLKQDGSDTENALPAHLSAAHRQRLNWSMNHPVLDWFCARHVAVSLTVALLTLLAVLGLAYRAARVRREARQNERIYTITIGQPPDAREDPASGRQPDPPESVQE